MDQELRELQRDYLRDVRETVEIIRRHGAGLASRGSFKTAFPPLLFLAHQLKGSGGSLGFPRITELAKQMSKELNLFLESEEESKRPTPQQLSETLGSIAFELEREVTTAQSALA
ncbi:MAG: Hpt domain-containing protein [Acidobacteriota bacterium]